MGELLLSPAYGLSKNQLKKTTAAVADVISGKKFYDSNGNLATGTLVDLGYEPEAKGGMMYENSLYVYVGENSGQTRWALTRGVRMPQSQVANIIGLSAEKLVSGQTVLGVYGTGRTSVSPSYVTINAQPSRGDGNFWYSDNLWVNSAASVHVSVGIKVYMAYNWNGYLILKGDNWADLKRIDLSKDSREFMDITVSGYSQYQLILGETYHAGDGTIDLQGSMSGWY